MSSKFRYQLFVAASEKLGGRVPVVDDVLSSHEQEIYPTTSFGENCRVWISNGSKILRSFETDVHDIETETCRESWLRNLQYQRGKKGAQRRRKSRRGRDGGRGGSSSSRYWSKQHNALNFFPMLKCTSTTSKFKTLMVCMRTNLTFSTTSREPSLDTRKFCTARGTTMKNFLMKLWKSLCRNLFSQGKWKCLADLMVSCCMVNWGLTFSPLLNCYTQIWKLGYD